MLVILPTGCICRNLLAFIYIPVIQKEMNIFRETVWNSHRVRHQRDAQMPKGIPNHLYAFPEQYGAEDCGIQYDYLLLLFSILLRDGNWFKLQYDLCHFITSIC